MISENLVDSNNKNHSAGKTVNWFQYFCGITANLLIVSTGFAFSWPSSVIPKLQSNNTEINPFSTPITTIQISTLAALPPLGGCLGYILALRLADIIGRKKTLFTVSVVIIISFTTLAFVKEIYIYFICVFINGVCENIALATVPVYVAEISRDENRGKLSYMFYIAMPLGGILGYSSGMTNIRTIGLIGTLCPLLFILLSFLLPESPIFLAMKGREINCLKSLEKLRRTKNVEVEYEKIQKIIHNSNKNKLKNILDIFKKRASIKAFLLSLEVATVQHASGSFIISVFMAPIFNEAGSKLSGDAVGILIDTVKIIVVFIAAFFIDRFGRRSLLLVSSITCILTLLCLGLYFYLKFIGSAFIVNLRWVSILCAIIYSIGFSIGLGPIPITLMNELFSNELRAAGGAIVLFVNSSIIFVTLFSFPLISEAIGIHFSLWICCICSIIGFFMMYFTIPETAGKSFSEIQSILGRRAL